ncbi:MAG: MoxR family ATPase [Candidatus Marinimicrobia bacterium]|jgi:MoxR-like ATPase|nr:MoxR family ATPase [Candidatus Neomarinimicrobiota bacterium]MBT3945817.1 MoxR family ATPase [Candidatus Neomarinimicrobiota bacterium]MBT4555337.1 MoxR family ATPase [Candidatus Neomarinimicrobiota bacterium]MBT4752745.1 MoxR family ATPase [Candidatus Neomarinimicrobiota bacterium]MBT5114446.1 MoxR family ATPase [Candidatus Neomarinimicrobiota bacterium]|tara:strand:+ start:217 stop:1212 length:996 start_codon:yes stop_codon:yes gene_type:complete
MTKSQQDLAILEQLTEAKDSFSQEVGKVIIGQKDILDHMLIALLARGHSLLVGVPGLAKTLLIKTLSDVLDLSFKRIQFTPDLMPSDITGTELIDVDPNSGQRSFRFYQGPIFANIVLADEINRTPPKTQAALLEAMQEHKVTAGGTTYDLDEPFFVLATQNPIEQEGTYPLPEAQLDRFMFNLKIDYPSVSDEIAIVRETTTSKTQILNAIMTKAEIASYQELVRRVPVADNVVEFAVKLVRATRPDSENAPDFIQHSVDWGAGPRASQYLVLGAKAKAILEGRPTPNTNDIRSLGLPILRHRVLPNFNAEAEGLKVDDILNQLLETILE